MLDHEINEVNALEARRLKFLKIEEETWHIKIQSIWIAQGEKNTRFFHSYVEHRRVSNTILILNDYEGRILLDQKKLEEATICHFQYIFKDPRNNSIFNQMMLFNAIL